METATPTLEPTQAAPEQTATDASTGNGTAGLAEAIRNTHYGITPEPEPTPAQDNPPVVEPVVPVQPEPVQPVEENASPAPAVPAQDYGQWLQEQTGGVIKEADQLKSLLTDPISLLPEHEQQLLKVARSGMDPMEYQRLQSIDFKAMEPKEVLRHDFLDANKHIPPHLKEAAFNKFLNSKYPNLEGFGEDDQDSQLDQLALQHEANEKRSAWEKKQEEMRLIPAAEKQTEGLSPQELEQRTAAHLLAVEDALKTDQLTFEVKSGEETKAIPFKISQTPDFKQALTEPDQFILGRWANPDGTHNYAQEQRDIATLQNLPKILQAVYEQGLSANESNVLKTLENPAPNASIAAPSTEPDGRELAAAISRAYSSTTGSQYAKY